MVVQGRVLRVVVVGLGGFLAAMAILGNVVAGCVIQVGMLCLVGLCRGVGWAVGDHGWDGS